MHVFDYLVDVLSRLFRFHNYSPRKKAYAAPLFLAGLMDVSERYASGESVREWVHRLRRAFNTIRKPRRLVAVDETVEKRLGERVYLWSAVDVYASKGRSILNALALLRRVLDACEGKPIIRVHGIHGHRILPRDLWE